MTETIHQTTQKILEELQLIRKQLGGDRQVTPGPVYREHKTEHIEMPEGESNFMLPGKYFDEIIGEPIEEVYIQYEVYIPDGFEFASGGNPGGCKLPGVLNTTTGAATGGRDADGTSWSARAATIRPNHPWCRDVAEDSDIKILSQVYHLDAPDDDDHGEHIVWNEGWDRGEWVTLGQYVKLNDPDASDGILRCWVDGEEALHREDIKFRDTDESIIERIWWGTYFGGSWNSPRDQYLELRNLEVWENDRAL